MNELREFKKNYIPELDGIRAIAIIAVFVNHLNPNLIPSGYLGVDIFFTLSGFVISYSIDNKIYKNKYEFIKTFYLRRFKRLAPTLIIYIIIISFLIAFFIHSGGTYYITGISSIFGLSNIFLLKINSGYWGNDSLMNPFTNTWSLSLEEQFYFIFPFLTTLIFSQNKKIISFNKKWVYLLTFFSFILYLILFKNFSEETYYFTLTRIWQISLGIICFICYKNFNSNNKSSAFLSTFSLLIIISSFFLKKDFSFLGHIVSSIFTFALILSLKKRSFVNKIMANKLFKSISNLSYQLYLWHWGFIVLMRWTYGLNVYSSFFVIILTFSVSYLVNKYIEKPFREKNIKLTYKTNILSLLVVSLIPFSLGKPLRNKFYISNLSGEEKLKTFNKKVKIIIHGDSHADDIWKILKNNQIDNKLVRNVAVGCKYYENYSSTKNCSFQKVLNKRLLKKAQEDENIIILAAVDRFVNENKFKDENHFRNELEKIKLFILNLIENSNSNIILKLPHTIVNSPQIPKPIRCIKRSYRPNINEKCFVGGVENINNKKKFKAYKTVFMNIAKEKSNFYIWDISSLLCPDDLCYPVTSENQYLHDESHLFYTSPNLNNKIVKSLNKIFDKF